MLIAAVLGAAAGLSGAVVAGLVVAAATAPSSGQPRRVDLTAKGLRLRVFEGPIGKLAVYEGGSGRPLVFLHGIGGGASSYSWRAVAPAFLDRYRVIAPDLPGWGASGSLNRKVTFEDYQRQIAALLQQVGKSSGAKPIVLTESLAGGFAAQVANQHPDLIEHLVLISPIGLRDFGRPAFPAGVRYSLGLLAATPILGKLLYRALFHRRSTYQSFFAGAGGFGEPARVEADLVDASWWSGSRPGASWSALPFVTAELHYDLATILERLVVPTTMIWASRETFISEPIQRALRALNPRIRNLTVPIERGAVVYAAPAGTIAAIQAAIGREASAPA